MAVVVFDRNDDPVSFKDVSLRMSCTAPHEIVEIDGRRFEDDPGVHWQWNGGLLSIWIPEGVEETVEDILRDIVRLARKKVV